MKDKKDKGMLIINSILAILMIGSGIYYAYNRVPLLSAMWFIFGLMTVANVVYGYVFGYDMR